MPLKKATIEALNQSFPTIITSGTILAAAGILIGILSTNPAISSIGVCLGRGTLISIFLVMGILPQILLLGDTIIEKTAITMKLKLTSQNRSGNMRVHGHMRGYVSGMVDGEFNGTIRGTLNAALETDAVENEEEESANGNEE